jgi:hypothetical protein
MKLQLSPNKLIQRAIESALDKGEYITPEPYYNLQRAIATGQQYFSWAILQEYPEERIDMVRRFIDECSSMLAQSQQPLPQPIPPAAAMQQAQLAAPVTEQMPMLPVV